MTIGDRIRLIREDKKISGAELGRTLEMTRGNISKMEKSERVVTDRTISQICSTFNVNEHWLRTGEGDMYIQMSDEEHLMKFVAELSKDDNEDVQKVAMMFAKLGKERRAALYEYAEFLTEKEKKSATP